MKAFGVMSGEERGVAVEELGAEAFNGGVLTASGEML